MRGSLDKAKIRGALQTSEIQQAKRAKDGFNSSHSQEGDANRESIFLPSRPRRGSPNKAKGNSTKEELGQSKEKPIGGSLQAVESDAKRLDEGGKGNTNMDGMTPHNMLRFLEKEEALLTKLQSKISAELSRLQVEEHVFLHTLKILGQKHASVNTVDEEDQQQTSSGDQDLIDALNEALMENGESVPSKEDISEETSEEVSGSPPAPNCT